MLVNKCLSSQLHRSCIYCGLHGMSIQTRHLPQCKYMAAQWLNITLSYRRDIRKMEKIKSGATWTVICFAQHQCHGTSTFCECSLLTWQEAFVFLIKVYSWIDTSLMKRFHPIRNVPQSFWNHESISVIIRNNSNEGSTILFSINCSKVTSVYIPYFTSWQFICIINDSVLAASMYT